MERKLHSDFLILFHPCSREFTASARVHGRPVPVIFGSGGETVSPSERNVPLVFFWEDDSVFWSTWKRSRRTQSIDQIDTYSRSPFFIIEGHEMMLTCCKSPQKTSFSTQKGVKTIPFLPQTRAKADPWLSGPFAMHIVSFRRRSNSFREYGEEPKQSSSCLVFLFW